MGLTLTSYEDVLSPILLIRASSLLARVQNHPKEHTYGVENPCASHGRIERVEHPLEYCLLTQGVLHKLLHSKLHLHMIRFDAVWGTELIFDSAWEPAHVSSHGSLKAEAPLRSQYPHIRAHAVSADFSHNTEGEVPPASLPKCLTT